MKRHQLIAELVRQPWAILESYVPVVTQVLARIVRGEPVSADDRARIDDRRKLLRLAHPLLAFDDYDDSERAPPEPYARVSGTGYQGAIAVVPVYGVLTQRGGVDMDTSEPLTSMSRVAQAVQLAAADPLVGGIVLDVDSPGGTVYGVSELADAIYGARETKPVAAVSNSLMASAAFWSACQAAELYCAPGGEVGSIGVYTIHINFAEAMKEAGVAVEMISAGKYKTEGNPYGPLTAEARAHIQASVDQYYDSFVRAVARGRGVSLKAVREGMGQGRVLQPDQAKAENMIDGIATLAQVVSKIGARAKRNASSARAAMQREIDIQSRA